MAQQIVPQVAQNFIFPEDEFGIINTNSDQTSLLQAAVNAASAQGRILILPPYTIKLSQLVIPRDGLTMWGQYGLGSDGVRPMSCLESIGANTPIVTLSTALTRHLELRGFRIKGTTTGSNQHGLYSVGSNNAMMKLEDLVVHFCGGNGVHLGTTSYSMKLSNIYSSYNSGHQFYIDGLNSPCVALQDCYAGVVTDGNYGFYFPRGNTITLFNCNSLDGGAGNLSCVRVGDGAIGTAFVTFLNCNVESFTQYGIFVDTASDIVLMGNNSFVAPSSGSVQPIYMIQPGQVGRSYIDPSTLFLTGGATYNNPSNLPIYIYDRFINAPYGITPTGINRVEKFWNGEFNKEEPFANLASRLATVQVTDNYTETRPTANYIGVNKAGAVAIHLLDPQSQHCPEGRMIMVKDESGAASSNNITIDTVNTRNIDGGTSYVINTNYGFVRLLRVNNKYVRIG